MMPNSNVHAPSSKRVGIRQIQKRAKKESDVALDNVADSMEWLSESQELNLGGESPSQEATLVAAVELDVQNCTVDCPSTICDAEIDVYLSNVPSGISSPNFIMAEPTRMSELLSDVNSSSSEEEERRDDDLCTRLQHWYVASKVNLKQLQMLLSELRVFHPELPRDARTVVKTPRITAVRQLNNGNYVHMGLEVGLTSRLRKGTVRNNNELGLDVNMDGLRLSNSSNVEAWPILVRCKDLRDMKPFSVGFFCGSSKPDPLDSYLDDYIKEVQKLTSEGLVVEGKFYKVYVRSYICDAPARAYLKCIKGHGGYFGCERCIQEGDHDGRRMIYDMKISTLRTDESFEEKKDEDHHTGVSPLLKLNTKMVSMFPLDPLHLLLHRVLKRFLLFLIGKFHSNAKLSAAEIQLTPINLINLTHYIPREFARKPRSLAFIGRWKATELRLFLLYTGLIALRSVVADEVYSLFLLLHVASRIVTHPELVKDHSYVDCAEKLFFLFVEHCADKTVFGQSFIVYNVHSILHLCDDVRKYGAVTDFSTFPFENHLGIIKRMVRSGVNIPQQIGRRLLEVDAAMTGDELSISEPTLLSPCGYDEITREFKSLVCEDFILRPLSSKDGYFKIDQLIGHLKKNRRKWMVVF